MFKKFKKNENHASAAFHAYLVGAGLIALVFIIAKFGAIVSGVNTLIGAMSAFIYGFCIAYICNPLYKRYHKYVFKFVDKNKEHPKLRKGLSIFSSFITFFGIIVILLLIIIPQVVSNVKQFVINIEDNVAVIVNWINGIFDALNAKFPDLNLNMDTVIASITDFFASSGGEDGSMMSTIVSVGISVVGTVIGQVVSFAVGVVLAIYFLIYKESICAKIKKFLCAILKKDKYEKFMDFANYSDKTVGKYLIGTVIDSIIVGIVVGSLVGLFRLTSMPALIGVIVGITNMIPFFGPFIGAIPSAVIIWVDGGFWNAFIFVILILIVQQIDGNIIMPHIVGHTTGLTPIGVIAAVTLFSHLLGIVGMLIGVPIFAIISYIISNIVNGKLKKKNLPTDTDVYENPDLFSNENFMQAVLVTEACSKIEEKESIENAKIDSELREIAIQEIEEQITGEKEQISMDINSKKI